MLRNADRCQEMARKAEDQMIVWDYIERLAKPTEKVEQVLRTV